MVCGSAADGVIFDLQSMALWFRLRSGLVCPETRVCRAFVGERFPSFWLTAWDSRVLWRVACLPSLCGGFGSANTLTQTIRRFRSKLYLLRIESLIQLLFDRERQLAGWVAEITSSCMGWALTSTVASSEAGPTGGTCGERESINLSFPARKTFWPPSAGLGRER